MIWITSLSFLAALVWTAISFMAYRDLDFAFRSSLVAWLLFGLVWVVSRVNFARLVRSSHVSEKVKFLERIVSRNRVAVAGVVAAAFLGIFVLTISTGQWPEKRSKAGKEGPSIPLASGTELSARKPSLQPSAKDKPKGDAATGEITQKAQGLWSVQIAAFKSEQDAVKLANALKDRGYEAYVIRTEVNAVNLYRTKVGRFKTREEAEKLLLVLRNKEAYPTAFVASM